MRVLIACEESQVVCKAFRSRGHEAFSCDVVPCSGGKPEWHIRDDVLNHLNGGWDLMIAHPPCTYLCNSGVRWLYYKVSGVNVPYQDRWNKMMEAAHFFEKLLVSDIHKICIENPVPHKHALDEIEEHLWTFFNRNSYNDKGIPNMWVNNYYPPERRKYNQIIQPWQFGHGETKATCLWLKNLPKLQPTRIVEGRLPRIHFMTPGPERSRERSKTYQGIADAMAEQWGNL